MRDASTPPWKLGVVGRILRSQVTLALVEHPLLLSVSKSLSATMRRYSHGSVTVYIYIYIRQKGSYLSRPTLTT